MSSSYLKHKLRAFHPGFVIGNDIVSVARIRRLLSRGGPAWRARVEAKIFVPYEIEELHLRFGDWHNGDLSDALVQHIAGRWAAKEAMIKACHYRRVFYKDVAILRQLRFQTTFGVILDRRQEEFTLKQRNEPSAIEQESTGRENERVATLADSDTIESAIDADELDGIVYVTITGAPDPDVETRGDAEMLDDTTSTASSSKESPPISGETPTESLEAQEVASNTSDTPEDTDAPAVSKAQKNKSKRLAYDNEQPGPNGLTGQQVQLSISHDTDYATAVCLCPDTAVYNSIRSEYRGNKRALDPLKPHISFYEKLATRYLKAVLLHKEAESQTPESIAQLADSLVGLKKVKRQVHGKIKRHNFAKELNDIYHSNR